MELDQLDQNQNANKAGDPIGRLEVVDNTPDGSLQPYAEVFDINRFRECELLHGRWAMLGFVGFAHIYKPKNSPPLLVH
jgi:light-harvesting complex II chlorophyll a/b binding protein 4